MTPARLHALYEIDQRDLPGWPARELPRLRPIALSDPRDVDLSERIVVGVVKHQLALRHAIGVFSGRPVERVDVAAQKILAVALEQMRSLDRVPAHAIVDDAVEQTKRVGPRGASGFVNAVLRKAAGVRGRVEIGDVDAGTRAEQTHSMPRGAFAKFASLYGDARAIELCEGFNREPPTLGRLIGGATLEEVAARGILATPHDQAGLIVLDGVRRDQIRQLADANLVQIQDATSAAVVDDLLIAPGHRVLDRCCGRGTKTRQLLERAGASGRVVAMDTSVDRLASVRASLKSAIDSNHLRVVHAGSVAALGDGEAFERVLIDAPCSNSGVLARRPEARYRQSPRELREVAQLQTTVLSDSASVVAPFGLLAYVTCSVWPEENEAIVDAFLRRHDQFERASERSTAPNPADVAASYRDGGYVCVLRRR